MQDADQKRLWVSIGWWSVWVLSFVASLLPMAVHHGRGISEIIEPFRYGGALLPAQLLCLRWFGELSHWIPLILIAILVGSIRKPLFRRGLFSLGAMMTAVFTSIYAAYSLLVVSMYLAGYTYEFREKHKAEVVSGFTEQKKITDWAESSIKWKEQPGGNRVVTFTAQYFYGDKIRFDSVNGKGVGYIDGIFLANDGSVYYSVQDAVKKYESDGRYVIHGGIYPDEITLLERGVKNAEQ